MMSFKPNGWDRGHHWLQQVTDVVLLKNSVYDLEKENHRLEKENATVRKRVVILNKQIEGTKRTANRAYRDMQNHLDYPDYEDR